MTEDGIIIDAMCQESAHALNTFDLWSKHSQDAYEVVRVLDYSKPIKVRGGRVLSANPIPVSNAIREAFELGFKAGADAAAKVLTKRQKHKAAALRKLATSLNEYADWLETEE